MCVPNTLSIMLTDKCNFECKHCSVDSGPDKNNVLSIEMVKKLLDEAFFYHNIRVVAFTGGEVTLYEDLLMNSIKYAHKLGFMTRIVTNAWWASDIQKTEYIMKKLTQSGLDELNVSFDIFHYEEMKKRSGIENYNNIITKCIEYGIVPVLCDMTYRGSHEMKENLSCDVSKVLFLNGILGPFGRARFELDKDIFIPCNTQNECLEILNTIAVLPNGNISYCCGHAIFTSKQDMFVIGSILVDSLSDVLERIKKNKLVIFLNKVGPEPLLRKLGFKNQVYSNCDACYYLANNYTECIKNEFMKNKHFLDIPEDCYESKSDYENLYSLIPSSF